MSDEREEIRSRISIVDLVGQTVALKKAGKDWKGLCPFHDDRNPSFTVSEHTGRYKCWSCNEAGDVFNWVMKTQNVEFPEALKILADRAGVILKPRSGERDKSTRELHAAIMNEACAFFVSQLSISDAAKNYLENRGIDQYTVKDWELGYAPDIDIALGTHLKKKGFPLQEAKSLFLVDSDAGGGFFDKFRGRLMFPIRDERGELVAFGGRILGDGQPKYINSGDTPLFRKSRVLYGMHRAKEAIASTKTAVLVEGYLDVIACHRAGVMSAVASLGTSLTEDHAKLLKRWCEQVVVLYDGDEAGKKAAERALDILAAAGNKVRVSLLPEGQDPDTLLKSIGAAAVEKAASEGHSPLEFRLATIESNMNPNQDDFWNAVVEALASSDSMRAVGAQVARLVQKYHPGSSQENEEKILLNDVRRARAKEGRKKVPQSAVIVSSGSRLSPLLSAQEAAVFKAMLEESTREEAWECLSEKDLFAGESARRLQAGLLATFGPLHPKGTPAEWLNKVEPEEDRELLASLEYLLDLSNLESLRINLELLRKARETRSAESIKQGGYPEEDLNSLLGRLREAARLDPFRPFDDSP